MVKFRKKSEIIKAAQWFDSSNDVGGIKNIIDYRMPEHGEKLQKECKHCGQAVNKHGWLNTKSGGHIVCPGDWIIVGTKGEKYPCKPAAFNETYERVEEI